MYSSSLYAIVPILLVTLMKIYTIMPFVPPLAVTPDRF
jgi:hypothetical protein